MGFGGWFSWLKSSREKLELQRQLTNDPEQLKFIDAQLESYDKEIAKGN